VVLFCCAVCCVAAADGDVVVVVVVLCWSSTCPVANAVLQTQDGWVQQHFPPTVLQWYTSQLHCCCWDVCADDDGDGDGDDDIVSLLCLLCLCLGCYYY